MRNNDSVVYMKNLVQKIINQDINKLSNYVERINYGCSKSKPIAKSSLLNLIPEIFSEKIENDLKADLDNIKSDYLDVFFHKFMESKFKIKKLIRKHCEATIMSIILYSGIFEYILR